MIKSEVALPVVTGIFSNWSNLSEDEIFELLVNITKQNEEDLLEGFHFKCL